MLFGNTLTLNRLIIKTLITMCPNVEHGLRPVLFIQLLSGKILRRLDSRQFVLVFVIARCLILSSRSICGHGSNRWTKDAVYWSALYNPASLLY